MINSGTCNLKHSLLNCNHNSRLISVESDLSDTKNSNEMISGPVCNLQSPISATNFSLVAGGDIQ